MENENNQQEPNVDLNKTNVMPTSPEEAQEQMQANAISTPPVSSQNNVPNDAPVGSAEKESKVGPVIGSIIVILIIVGGGLYFWNSVLEKRDESGAMMEDETTPDEELSGVEADLEAFDTTSMDAELDAIDAEFEAN